jgi:hypothetical protein
MKLTADWVRALRARGFDVEPAEHKFHARSARGRVGESRGRHYKSTVQFERLEALRFCQIAGVIADLQEEQTITLMPGVTYQADACYFDVQFGERITEEVKGKEGERWRLVRNVWRLVGPTWLLVVKRNRDGAIVVTQRIPPGPYRDVVASWAKAPERRPERWNPPGIG